MTKELPRGIRNNNPGNVEDDGHTAWQGLDEPRNDGRFLRAKTAAEGIRILARVLITYQDKRRAADGSPIDTVPDFINRFAPPRENDTDAYIDAVCADLGITQYDTVSVHDYRTAKALVVAITAHENANYKYPDSVVDEGLRLAGIMKPVTSVATDKTVLLTSIGAASGVAAQVATNVNEIWGAMASINPMLPHFVVIGLGGLGVLALGYFMIDRIVRRVRGIA